MFSCLPRAIALVALASSIAASDARADDYPSRPVKIYIENRPGAGTTIGTGIVAKADPDGYTLLMVSGTQTVNEMLYPNKPYHLLQDLVPIAPLIETDLVLVEHPSVAAKNLAELLALARDKPGTLNFGSSGPRSNYHMAAELLKNLTGIDIVHVPYKGSTGMRSDILSGQIQLLFDSVPTMAPLIDSGAARARNERHDAISDSA